MRRSILTTLFALQIASTGCAQDAKPPVGGGCDGCELMFEGMPEDLAWRTDVARADEAGTPLVVRGVIYRNDGRTPAPGVILYVYQTDAPLRPRAGAGAGEAAWEAPGLDENRRRRPI